MLIIDKIIYWLFLIPFIATPFLVFNWIWFTVKFCKRKKKGGHVHQSIDFPYKSVLGFVVPIFVIFLLSSIMTTVIRNDVCEFLSTVGLEVMVTVEGKTIEDAQPVIRVLQQISSQMGHHSHPERRIRLVIMKGDQTLKLDLGRDSERPTEYWVFYPHYRHTSDNEIGRISTKLFDAYK